MKKKYQILFLNLNFKNKRINIKKIMIVRSFKLNQEKSKEEGVKTVNIIYKDAQQQPFTFAVRQRFQTLNISRMLLLIYGLQMCKTFFLLPLQLGPLSHLFLFQNLCPLKHFSNKRASRIATLYPGLYNPRLCCLAQ